MQDTGQLIEKGPYKGGKLYERKEHTKKYIVTSEAIAVWENFSGKIHTNETSHDTSIINSVNLCNVFKDKTNSTPVKDENGQESKRLYKLYGKEMEKADHDKIQGVSSLVLAYRPVGGTKHRGSQMIIMADFLEKKFYYTDQEGDLSTQLTGNSGTLADAERKYPKLASQYLDRFLRFHAGKAGWHLDKQQQRFARLSAK